MCKHYNCICKLNQIKKINKCLGVFLIQIGYNPLQEDGADKIMTAIQVNQSSVLKLIDFGVSIDAPVGTAKKSYYNLSQYD